MGKHHYTYNTLEQLSEVQSPARATARFSGDGPAADDAVTSYTYTPTGNVSQVTDADSGTTTYGYDAIGEQTSVSLPDPATGLAGGPTTTTAYDALGRVVSVTTPPMSDGYTSTTSYSYEFGQYDEDGDTGLPGMTVVTTLPDPTYGTADGPQTTDVYDQDGNLVRETSPRPPRRSVPADNDPRMPIMSSATRMQQVDPEDKHPARADVRCRRQCDRRHRFAERRRDGLHL